MFRIFIVVLVVFIGSSALAQQKLQMSQYMLNQYILNPAVGGTSDFFEANAGYRLQWAGLEGAPRTFYVSLQGPIAKAPEHYNYRKKKQYHHGLGFYAASDKTGLLSRTMVYGSYAYNMPITKKIRLSTGLFLGFQQHRIEGSKVIMDGYDPSLPASDINVMVPDVSLGSWLYSKEFYVGISANQMLRNRIDYRVNNPGAADIGRLKYHYFLTGGVKVPFAHNEWEWIPSLLVKAVSPAPLSVDLNSKFRYKKMYWAGMSYRTERAVALLVGLTVAKQFHFGYSYDFSFSDLADYHANSHEIVLGYSIRRNWDVWSPTMFW